MLVARLPSWPSLANYLVNACDTVASADIRLRNCGLKNRGILNDGDPYHGRFMAISRIRYY